MKNLKNMPKSLTAVYKKSVTGNKLIGYLKEYPDAISQGDDKDELAKNLIDSMFALMEAKSKYGSDIEKRFDGDAYEMQVPLIA